MDDHGYAVGWGTLSLLKAGLAQAKGRRGLVWWVLSLLLGPLATLLIVVLPIPPGPRVRSEKLTASSLPEKL